jgi:hypothetical protein
MGPEHVFLFHADPESSTQISASLRCFRAAPPRGRPFGPPFRVAAARKKERHPTKRRVSGVCRLSVEERKSGPSNRELISI